MSPNLHFNVEFAKITGIEINLSNKQKQALKELKSAEEDTVATKILNNDLSIQVDVKSLKRRPIGFVTRGEFSQARGQGMGIGVI